MRTTTSWDRFFQEAPAAALEAGAIFLSIFHSFVAPRELYIHLRQKNWRSCKA